MRTDRRQDAGMDRLLRTALDEAAGGTAEDCPGPDELGGYLERALPAEEMRSLEQHFAACDRCQQVLATLAVMPGDTHPTALAGGWWSSRPWWRWLVPAAAVASALILFVALKPQLATEPTEPKRLEPGATIAQQLPSTPAPSMAAPAIAMAPSAPLTRRPRATPPPRGSSTVSPSPSAAAAAPPGIGGLPAVPSAPPSASPEGSLALMRASARADRANAKAEGAAKQAPPDAKQGGARTTIVADAANKPSAQPVKAAAEAAPAPVASGAAMMETVVVAEPGRAAAKRQAAVPIVLLGPGSTRWRLEPGGGISRSTDSGATWQVQRPAGGTVLLAGAAPTATVCWAVGAAGTVLLTTDGRRWDARPFPERTDLVAVTADDGEGVKATVTTRDGRRFATSDSGASWVQR